MRRHRELPCRPVGAAGVPQDSRRLQQLDVLRALAVVLVLGRHMVLPPTDIPGLSPFFEVWQRGGWVGVDLFFVLSGFLVSGLLFDSHQRTGSIDAKRFLIRRGLKIYPSFWFFIFVTLILDHVVGRRLIYCIGSDCEVVDRTRQTIVELLFVQNYGGEIAGVPALWGHTWSLAVEEHFYLAIAALFFVLVRRCSSSPFNRVPVIGVALLAVCVLLRLGTAPRSYEINQVLFPTHLRMDALMVGVVLAFLWRTYPPLRGERVRQRRWWHVSVGVALIAPAFVFPVEDTNWILTIGLTMNALGGALIILGSLHCSKSARRLVRGTATLGIYSYTTYLWHLPIVVYLFLHVEQPSTLIWLTFTTIYFVGSPLVGVVTARLVEIPVLRLRDRLWPSTVPQPSTAQAAAGEKT